METIHRSDVAQVYKERHSIPCLSVAKPLNLTKVGGKFLCLGHKQLYYWAFSKSPHIKLELFTTNHFLHVQHNHFLCVLVKYHLEIYNNPKMSIEILT